MNYSQVIRSVGHSYLIRVFLTLILSAFALCGICQADKDILVITHTEHPIAIGKHTYIFLDSSATIDINKIREVKGFKRSTKSIGVYQVPTGNIWVKFQLENLTKDRSLFVNLPFANISRIDFYKVENDKLVKKYVSGNALRYSKRNKTSTNHVFDLKLKNGETGSFYIRISSHHPVLLPILIEAQSSMEYSESVQTIVTGIYIGILLAIILYNFFLFISTRDRNYAIYITYLFFLGLAQIVLAGYAFQFLWPLCPEINKYALVLSSALAGITGLIFAICFLRAKYYLPKALSFLYTLLGLYLLAIILTLAGFNAYSYLLQDVTTLVAGLTLIIVAAIIGRKGYKPAYFYLVAWIAFLVGMVAFVLRNWNLLPYNNFTTYMPYFGSAIEAILLSIALADKINTLRKEKEQSQELALSEAKKNEQFIKERNADLEVEVTKRTKELQATNTQLSDAYKDLKDAQIQLVEAEKMASLGQLTAGIAHEINNPINFVKSNIKPLKLDFKDMVEVIDEYERLHTLEPSAIPDHLKQIERLKKDVDLAFIKTEINGLMMGIEEGAERTAEIVRGLRTFSRLDESQIKVANIHDGLDSTLVLLRNNIPLHVNVIKEYKANGNIECFPGKLNQVFMNIINNAIQAMNEKNSSASNEFIKIATEDLSENEIQITIKDSGPGMSDDVKHKIFDPFFTTKDVGEGTGLGLAIAFRIIKEHGGKITVNSKEGEGSEFILTLFHTIPTAF